MIFKKYFSLWLTFTSLIVFTGCVNDLEGVYVANHNVGNDTLKIYSGYRYVRIFYDASYKLNDEFFIDSGIWNKDNGTIYFRDWVDRSGTGHSETGKKIIFGAEIRKKYFSDEIKLMINYDLDYYYLKQK